MEMTIAFRIYNFRICSNAWKAKNYTGKQQEKYFERKQQRKL